MDEPPSVTPTSLSPSVLFLFTNQSAHCFSFLPSCHSALLRWLCTDHPVQCPSTTPTLVTRGKGRREGGPIADPPMGQNLQGRLRVLDWDSANLFWKWADSKYFQTVCHKYPTPPFWCESWHRRYASEWVWLYLNKPSSRDTEM